MKRKYSGMTLIEILTVITIIVVLAGLLIPVMTLARKGANEVKQKAELNAIELAITAFKNDYGDYPPSERQSCETANDYSGAQKLAEALCGWDLLGFDSNSVWRSDGADCSGANPAKVYPRPLDPINNPAHASNLKSRKGPYLDTASISVFKLSNLFNNLSGNSGTLADTFVLSDVFGVRSALVGGKNVKAGTPILYYKANPASKMYDVTGCTDCTGRIYDFTDNKALIDLGRLTSDGTAVTGYQPPLHPGSDNGAFFYGTYIRDTRIPIPWPYRPDSYLLISAGADGEYGTKDDIRNF